MKNASTSFFFSDDDMQSNFSHMSEAEEFSRMSELAEVSDEEDYEDKYEDIPEEPDDLDTFEEEEEVHMDFERVEQTIAAEPNMDQNATKAKSKPYVKRAIKH